MNQNNTQRGFTQISRLFSVPLAGKVREAGKGGLTWNIPSSALEDTSCAGEEVNRGFTLIELLVVVLIIGILAAVALPQYQKAVWRSRNTQLKTLVASGAQAMEMYYLENGVWPGNFDKLELDLPLQAGTKTCSYSTKGRDAVRKGKNFEILITSSDLQKEGNITAVWTDGPYRCDGFLWYSKTKKILCRQSNATSGFCTQIEKAVRVLPLGEVFLYE